jgi:hypothetical protein
LDETASDAKAEAAASASNDRGFAGEGEGTVIHRLARDSEGNGPKMKGPEWRTASGDKID